MCGRAFENLEVLISENFWFWKNLAGIDDPIDKTRF